MYETDLFLARRDDTTGSTVEIVEKRSGFVRCTIPYGYGHTDNAQQWADAQAIMAALSPSHCEIVTLGVKIDGG